MKKLIDFKNDETSISKIFGGAWVKTNSSRTNESGCKETIDDSFDDKNGDGKISSGESVIMCMSIDCPK